MTLDSPGGGASLGTFTSSQVTISTMRPILRRPPTPGRSHPARKAARSSWTGPHRTSRILPRSSCGRRRPDLGRDPGAFCTFTPVNSTDPTVSCTDDGTFQLAMSVYDGVNAPVTDTSTVTVSNAVPTVSIDFPTDGSDHALADGVEVDASISDPGANDALTCSIDWGDDTVTAGVVVPGQCSGSHDYLATGPYTIHVGVTDDDGGSTANSTDITVSDTPPTAPSLTINDASDGEGDVGTTPLTFTVTRSDPDPISSPSTGRRWTAARPSPILTTRLPAAISPSCRLTRTIRRSRST